MVWTSCSSEGHSLIGVAVMIVRMEEEKRHVRFKKSIVIWDVVEKPERSG
jgi:hypothetical protein